MSARTTSSHTFTKLIVGDPEKMAAFYKEVYGIEEIERILADGSFGRHAATDGGMPT